MSVQFRPKLPSMACRSRMATKRIALHCRDRLGRLEQVQGRFPVAGRWNCAAFKLSVHADQMGTQLVGSLRLLSKHLDRRGEYPTDRRLSLMRQKLGANNRDMAGKISHGASLLLLGYASTQCERNITLFGFVALAHVSRPLGGLRCVRPHVWRKRADKGGHPGLCCTNNFQPIDSIENCQKIIKKFS